MRVLLAAAGFKTDDIAYNRDRIIAVLKENAGKADLAVFGESFLQGFDALCWDYEKDRDIAVTPDDVNIGMIRRYAWECGMAVSFGYIERFGEKLYSSQLTVANDGRTLNNYRRISIGWKKEEAAGNGHYCEGTGYSVFELEGKSIAVGLCGDFWYDDNARRMKELGTDIVLWPVYTDYLPEEWNSTARLEYAQQAAKLGSRVLYVNSVCLDGGRDEKAMGGAVFFENGKIVSEIPSGGEGTLLIEI